MLGKNPQGQLERPIVDADGKLIVSTEGSPTGVLDSVGQAVDPATEGTLIELKASVDALEGGQSVQDELSILDEILLVARGIATARGVAGDLRVSVVGGTLPTVTTVTTVSTVNNMAQVGGVVASSLVPAQLNVAAITSNINNIVVS